MNPSCAIDVERFYLVAVFFWLPNTSKTYMEDHGRPWKTETMIVVEMQMYPSPWLGVLNPGNLSRSPWLQVQTIMFNAVSETPKHPLLVFKII